MTTTARVAAILALGATACGSQAGTQGLVAPNTDSGAAEFGSAANDAKAEAPDDAREPSLPDVSSGTAIQDSDAASRNSGPALDSGSSGADGYPDPNGSGTDAGQSTDSAVDAGPQLLTVRIVYLIPTDRTMDPMFPRVLQRSLEHLQIFYQQQMRNGRTFALYQPVVEAAQATHAASWYATNPRAGSSQSTLFWDNAINEGFALTGGRFNDPRYIWVYYIDADNRCGQIGGAGTSGTALMPANDLRGLSGRPLTPICPNDPFTMPRCRWVGGMGHELGHGFGLPHPPGCDNGAPTCDANALMWQGIYSYPNTYLRDDNRTALSQSPFFSPRTVGSLFDCNML